MRFMRLALAALMGFAAVSFAADTNAAAPQVTYNKDVLPILQKRCQTCHRPGQVAPMSFLSYESTRPWAKAMKAAVVTRKMPPWFADPQYQHFVNDRSLEAGEIETISRWADSGAAEGDAKDAPPAVEWPSDGWEIRPDIIVQGPEFKVPARPKNDVIEWMYITMPGNFAQDTWVTSMEIKPGNRAVTHHICVYFKPHTANVKYNVPVWDDKPRDENGNELTTSKARITGRNAGTQLDDTNGVEGCYVPGQAVQNYGIHGAGKLIKAGTDVVFQLHYTPNGQDITDQPMVGFKVSKEAPARRYVTLGISSPTDPKVFAIPPGDANWASPPAQAVFGEDVELVYMFPHMHVRGKDMTYKLIYPDGKTEIVLNVPKYDFNWQLAYDLAKPIQVPKGTRLVVTAHYDNSPNNKFNPNPNQTVYYGNMTWEEMMFPFFSVVIDKSADPDKVLKIEQGGRANGA